ncbi:phosphotransferase [Candidatus Marithioploca araucensis]|uniref:Phosphotransferase n=1 Tax=Candidatus Marithioploca araucensis TaxID=70273 RepID=A0ABT7VT81_9GAMM|nr:phosphotransferase [Candidatus Marithioploca araucensis]
MSQRLNLLQDWLQNVIGIHAPQLVAITNDASFRRYFRLTINGVSHIVMDAPPDKEDCSPFIDIAQRLRASGLNAPQVLESHLEQGFLLLTDLGSQLYLPALTNEAMVESLYGDALKALVLMQAHTYSDGLPLYDHQLLHNEMNLFTDWLLGKHLKLSLEAAQRARLKNCFELLSTAALLQPQVFVHRDYHSRNLMIVPKKNPGILDFQDAVKGPVTYDLVSLLRDCYIAWPRERVNGWAKDFYTQIQELGMLKDIDETEFLRWFDWMGIQRHLKASGIFARLYHRDGKSGYLKDIPRTLNYIVEVGADYPELAALYQLVSERVLPQLEGV